MLLTNIQSLRPKLDELSLIMSNQALDLVCLTETWLTPEVESNLVNIPGFTLVRSDRISRRGGGTAIYIRDELAFETTDLHERLSTEAEGTLVDFPGLNFFVFCIYVPPNLNSSTLSAITDDITDITDDHLKWAPNRNFVILGDFNEFDVKKLCLDLSLMDIVDKPTRGMNTLDHVLISEGLIPHYDSSSLSYESPIGKSDHLTLIIEPESSQRKLNNFRQHTVLDYRSSNLKLLLHKAECIDWDTMKDQTTDVNQLWRRLLSCITSLVDSSIPQKTVTLTSKDRYWMTPLTKLLINEKWSAYRNKDWERFQHLKMKTNAEIKKAKHLWTQKLRNSSNGVWNVTKYLSGKERRNPLQNLLTQYSSPRSLAEAIAATMKTDDDGLTKSDCARTLEDDDWTVDISVHEVQEYLRTLPPNKAAGLDGIPNKIYSLLAPFIAGPLKVIFDLSVAQRRFPCDWKKGIVIPIPKTQPPVLHKLRTITLLPSPSKIFEKLLLKKMRNQIEPLFGGCQHAFRRAASTTTALLKLTDTATRHFDDSNLNGFVTLSLDFSKAFDNVDHHTLVQKVSTTLPKGFALLLHSYLSERSFQVKIQGHISQSYRVHSGVPQGSVIGPALFSILVGDLPDCNSDNTFIQYADDVNIVIPLKHNDPDEVKVKVMKQLQEVSNWCSLNKQIVNADKSKLLLCTRRPMSIEVSTPIKRLTSMKILGVYVNDRLTWENHTTEVCRRACQRLHLLRIVKPHISQSELHEVYCALVRSLFDYCCPVFTKLPKKLTQRVQRIEKRAHRLIFGKNITCACDLDGFVKRRQNIAKKLFLNIQHNKQHLLHDQMPKRLPHSTRFSNFLCRTNKRQHSFFPYLTILLNGCLSHP